MPGKIGTDKIRAKQVFRQICPPGHAPHMGDNGNVAFYPWKRQTSTTRDSAAPTSIKGRADQQLTLAKVVAAMSEVDQRLSALEAKRSLIAQQQELFQRQMTMQQPAQPAPAQPTQDSATPPCVCQHQLAPHVYRDGVAPMSPRPVELAPNRHITFGSFPNPRLTTRDQNTLENNYLEKPSRFTSQEADRMARHIVGAGPPTTKEINDANRAYWARDGKQQYNTSGGHGVEAVASDPSERFVGSGPFDQFGGDTTRPSPAALSELNAQYSKARTPQARDAIEDAWKGYMRGARDDGGAQWKPRQNIPPTTQAPKKDNTDDANWSSLYEQNKSTIGGDPNKISPGMQLSMPGGGSHTVASGETLSGIASTPQGTDLGAKSLASERGGMESTPAPSGSYSSGGTLKSSEGAPSGSPATNLGSSAPTPPTRPSEFGGSAQAAPSSSSSETPTPPVKPASLGGTGESPEGLNPQAGEGGGASPTGSEGTGLAKFVRGLVGEE